MPRAHPISPETARLVKEALWTGGFQREIARAYGLSQSQVSRIRHGRTWSSVPWPDGSTGALPASAPGAQYKPEPALYMMESNPSVSRTPSIQQATVRIVSPEVGEELHENDAIQGSPIRKQEDTIDALRAIREEITEEEEREALEELAISSPSRETSRKREAEPDREEPWPWERCLREAGGNPLVQEAESSGNKFLKEAIQISFASLDPALWRAPVVQGKIRKLADELAM